MSDDAVFAPIVIVYEPLVNLIRQLDERRDIWVPNNSIEARSCFLCEQKFSPIRRKHHCRLCGKVVCRRCSGESIRLGQAGVVVRGCANCLLYVRMSQPPAALRWLQGRLQGTVYDAATHGSSDDSDHEMDESPPSSTSPGSSTTSSVLPSVSSSSLATPTSSGIDSPMSPMPPSVPVRMDDEFLESASINGLLAVSALEISKRDVRRLVLGVDDDDEDEDEEAEDEEEDEEEEDEEDDEEDEDDARRRRHAAQRRHDGVEKRHVFFVVSLGKQQTHSEAQLMQLGGPVEARRPGVPAVRVDDSGSMVLWPQVLYYDVTSMSDVVQLALVASPLGVDGSPGRRETLAYARMSVREISRTASGCDKTLLLTPKRRCHGRRRLQQPVRLRVRLHMTVSKKRVQPEDFELVRVVGRGNFGKVMMVRKKDTRRIYAMKVLRKDSVIENDAITHTMSERNVLRRISHPFIVSLKYSFQTATKLYMVMDYLSGGELFTHLSNVDCFSEERARFYAAQLVSALGYLHQHHIIYRDLKPENILLDVEGYLCITDFGLCKEDIGYGQKTRTFCGSPEYIAPELLQGQHYGAAVDWWALGTFLYEMLSGLPPFFDEDPRAMNRKILYAPLVFDRTLFSPAAVSLLEGLLRRDPETRLGSGVKGARDIMSHPFFEPVDWERLEKRQIDAPFRPQLRGEEDTRFFAEEFTQELPGDSYVDQTIPDQLQQVFEGFTYSAANAFNAMGEASSGDSITEPGSSVSDRRRSRLAVKSRESGSLSSSSGSMGLPGSPMRKQ